ncbi:acyl-CoA dehydrogenase C-terminal domain-containing protein [Novosphingobium profundi]|uniref:acyl-CoA dehydrogenase C-terminal domain-containing protein n=1 Tax=Novosphingobium profundi TaxID=1774954 RepID=UPI001BDB2129|nr:acyl-CoA dehydrogenase C-terminal domain-containing protein [Novosphingobium profundi]MBT0671026.1 acyl-CoA dehydrogenase C-terminal domain-containing protein [Novosphingobium profundi]
MTSFTPPVDDMRFLLTQVLDFDAHIATLPGCEDVTAEFAGEVLTEAGRFAADKLAPLNLSGDEQGASLADGKVTTPEGFPQAYKDFVEAGWVGLSGNPDFGGQGLPRTLQILLDEMVCAANVSFGLFPGLTSGAAEALEHHGSEELKARWLPGLITGESCGAMALTESNAGTDLGLLRARAEPVGDGSFKVSGTKIFISSGDQDFGNNIVHLVLARLPDAPAGVKGISMFLVPKFLPGEDGGLGARNTMSVGALEHKMGIHAQPTCVMNYDEAIGWLVGEPGRGLNAMFTMMNNERLFVGIQGLGIAEAAHQKAATYARERLQGRSADNTRAPVPIIEHADVRKMLLQGRAFIDAARALAVWTAMQMDIAARHPDPAAQAEANGMVLLMTPVIKAAFTDMGFETAVLSQQVFGGHGYIHEWGMEQFVRDARITQIYEGTNGVQAMDLVARKLPMEGGALLDRFLALVEADIAKGAASPLAAQLADALVPLRRIATDLLARKNDVEALGAAATDTLRMLALVALGWMWLRMVLATQGEESPLAIRKHAVARFFFARMLPQVHALAAQVEAGPQTIMAMDAELF